MTATISPLLRPCLHQRSSSRQLAGLCIAGLAVRLGAYAMRPGIVAPDEVFQYLEQAHRLVFHTGLVPWEYVLGIRNWITPGIIAGIMEAARPIGDGPGIQIGAVVLCLSLLSLCTVICGFRWGYNVGGQAAGLAAGGLNAFWFEQIYYAPHALADTIAAALLMSGLYLGYPGIGEPSRRRLFWGGILFGLTLVVRIQLGPAIALAGLWCCRSDPRRHLLPMMLGGLIPLGILGIVDSVTWGSPFRSVWLYVWLNADISEAFGRFPFSTFIRQELVTWWVFGPVIAGFALLGARRLPLPGVTVVAIVATFSLVAHKEARFIYPAVPLILTLAGIGSAAIAGDIAGRLQVRVSSPALGLSVMGIWIAVSAYLGIFGPFHPLWSGGTGAIAAFQAVSADPASCGLVVVPQYRWADSGGIVFLRPGIGLVSLAPDGSGAPDSGYNYLFTYDIPGAGDRFGDSNPAGVPADRVQCWNEYDARGFDARTCLWHVRTGCVYGHSVPLQATPPPFLARVMTWAPGH